MLIGPQYDYKTGEPVVGTSEYSGQPLVFVKDIKRFSEGKTEESTMYTGKKIVVLVLINTKQEHLVIRTIGEMTGFYIV